MPYIDTVPTYLLPVFILFAVVFNGLGFLFLRWPRAGAKSLQAFRDQSRWFIAFGPINVWTARLLGAEFAFAGLASTAALVYSLFTLNVGAGS